MGWFTAIFGATSFLLSVIVLVVYFYLRYVTYNFWNRKKVPHDKPSFPLGNLPISYVQGNFHYGDIITRSYEKFKKHPLHGVYLLFEPVLVINDPQLIQQILVKNFNNFRDRGRFSSQHKDPLSTALDRLSGEKWKRLRSKLSPAFTSGKIKHMYTLLEEICDELINFCDNSLKETDVLELKDLSTRYTVDCISSIAYGFNCNSLKNPDNVFLNYGKSSLYLGRIFVLVSFYMPRFVHLYPVPKIRQAVQKFFVDLFDQMVAQRKADKIVRNDFLNTLMQLMDFGKLQEEGENEFSSLRMTKDDKITLADAVGQAYFFFAAGQETTSSVITSCLYELALHQDIQEKLYQEIREVNESPGGLTYDKLFAMEYFDMIVQETLRIYSSTPVLNRICEEDFDVPNMNFRIEKGTRIVIPIIGLHHDPDIYPDPQKFDPERFSPENNARRNKFVYLPFGEGPRHCIGMRIGLMKSKMGLFHLLLNYKFSRCDESPAAIKYSAEYVFHAVDNKVLLKVERRKKLD